MNFVRQLAFVCGLGLFVSFAHAQSNPWDGEWVTDEGLMVLNADDDEIRGTYGDGGTLKGTARGEQLELTFRNGNSSGTVNLSLSDDGHSFDGQWETRRGSGPWRGWLKDSDAEDYETADFSGYWMTSWGPMQIEQDGDAVTGRYAAHGWSTFTGNVRGRRMTFEWKKLHFSGEAWLEQGPDGERLFGMTMSDDPSLWIGMRMPEFQHHVQPVAGEIVKGYADNGMQYHLRMPDEWEPGDAVDVIVLLHGSNWTTAGMVYITNENWPDVGRKYAILGIQGERWVKSSDADNPRFNYTYVNWMGRSTYEGFPYTNRESPYLVMQVIDELDELHSFDRVFLGGHSQGGYLTYVMHMHFPEKLAGTFPVAGGLIIQAEPDVFDDEDLKKAQRETPMAIIHGTRDGVVKHSTGVYNYNRFLAHDFPLTQFIQPESGHPYDFLPVSDAIEYLDMMTTEDGEALAVWTENQLEAKNWRHVGAAIQRARQIGAADRFTSISQAFEDAAKLEAADLAQSITANTDSRWIDGFLAWQEAFETSQAGSDAKAAYRALQETHDERAGELMTEARQAFRSRKSEKGWEKYQQIVDEFYASRHYRTVKNWIDNR
ncbi:MAG: hypothetical protein ACR2NP_19775 [Pirellulaceae bacterium]